MFSIRHEVMGYRITYDGYIHAFDDELRRFLLRSETYHISEKELKEACTRRYLDVLHRMPYAGSNKYMSFTFMIAETPRNFTRTNSYDSPNSIGTLSEPKFPRKKQLTRREKLLLLL